MRIRVNKKRDSNGELRETCCAAKRSETGKNLWRRGLTRPLVIFPSLSAPLVPTIYAGSSMWGKLNFLPSVESRLSIRRIKEEER